MSPVEIGERGGARTGTEIPHAAPARQLDADVVASAELVLADFESGLTAEDNGDEVLVLDSEAAVAVGAQTLAARLCSATEVNVLVGLPQSGGIGEVEVVGAVTDVSTSFVALSTASDEWVVALNSVVRISAVPLANSPSDLRTDRSLIREFADLATWPSAFTLSSGRTLSARVVGVGEDHVDVISEIGSKEIWTIPFAAIVCVRTSR